MLVRNQIKETEGRRRDSDSTGVGGLAALICNDITNKLETAWEGDGFRKVNLIPVTGKKKDYKKTKKAEECYGVVLVACRRAPRKIG